MKSEDWNPVVGWEEFYEISSLGRLRRLRSKKLNREGVILSGSVNPNGYRIYHLREGSRDASKKAHRLVAEAFIPNPQGYPLVLHGVNGVSDNSVDNLRWGTNSDNMRDRRRDGTDFEVNKTHCPAGHEYTPDNIHWNNSDRTHRKCRKCHNDRRRLQRKLKEAEKQAEKEEA